MSKELQFDIATLSAMCLAMSVLVACTRVPSPNTAPTATVPTGVDFTLPAPVYFLRAGQIWRLARDGATRQQITREASPITDFDVSAADGALVYVTDNRLIHTDAHGGRRQVLVAGPALTPAEDDLASLNDKSHIIGKVAAPRWSPDGDRIAYIQNGLNVMSISNGQVQTVHQNGRIPEQSESGAEGPLLFMGVIAWSPDGLHLLAEVYRYPLASLFDRLVGLKHFSDGSLETFHCVFCHLAWTADSQVFYTANPSMGGVGALGRHDIATGQRTLIGLDVPARSAYFYAYPHAPNQDEVYVFMASSASPAEPPAAFKMYKVRADGYGTTPLRGDDHPIQTALWARDGSGALIVTSSASDEIQADRLVWLPVDGSPAIALPVTGLRTLRWGADI